MAPVCGDSGCKPSYFPFFSLWVVFLFTCSCGRWCESFPPLSDILIKLENHGSSFSASARRHVCRQMTAVIYRLISSSSVVVVAACYFKKKHGCSGVINALPGLSSILCAYKLKKQTNLLIKSSITSHLKIHDAALRGLLCLGSQ